ncbi:MAG: hypothetical protein ACRYFS_07795 [Janthinobacterium lividum]
MKTLECEQVYLSEYDNLADANAQIGHFLEAVYNQKRCIPAWATCRPLSTNNFARRTETRTRPSHLN